MGHITCSREETKYTTVGGRFRGRDGEWEYSSEEIADGTEWVDYDIYYCSQCGAWKPNWEAYPSPYRAPSSLRYLLSAWALPAGCGMGMMLVFLTISGGVAFGFQWYAEQHPEALARILPLVAVGCLAQPLELAAAIIVSLRLSKRMRRQHEAEESKFHEMVDLWRRDHPAMYECRVCHHRWTWESEDLDGNPYGYTCEDARRAGVTSD